MKIVVPIKRVVDYSVRVRVKNDGSGIELANVKMSTNPFDEIALEEAIRLKEQNVAREVVAVTIGALECQDILRSALAMGADRAILVEANSLPPSPLVIAKLLRAIVQRELPHIVLMGKQAIDDDCNQTGQMLAGLLNWAQGTFISKLKLQEHQAIVTREVDGGLEELRLNLPAVITTDLRLNEPRYLSLPNIMKAKQKTIENIPVNELNVDLATTLKILKIVEPTQRKAGVKLQSVAELLDKLQNEARVL